MQHLTRRTFVGSLLASAGTLALRAGEPSPAGGGPRVRDVEVEEVRNESPGFLVRVDVDRPSRVYLGGQEMHAKVISEKPGYLHLFYRSAAGQWKCLFPNRIQHDNSIVAHKEIVVPAPDAQFRLRVGPPYGREVLKAVVTLQRVAPQQLGVKSLTEADATPLSPGDIKGMFVELKRSPAVWAEHQVELLTLPADKGESVRRRCRVGVFIGVSVYQDPKIRALQTSHRDAQAMAEVMTKHGRLDKAIVLVNQQATLANIRKAICKTVVEATRPGDEVFLFWSGHGGRCADDNGDEKDGYDEYLVPHDGRLDNLDTIRRTMLVDDTFGRWLLELDGRRVVLLLDTCYSAGQSSYTKGLGSPGPAPAGEFDFLDDVLARTKDIGQRETAMLAAAKADQLAFMRRERDLSAMTYYLSDLLARSDSPVTLTQAFEHLKLKVPAYVEERFPNSTQTPVLVDHTTPPLYLRP